LQLLVIHVVRELTEELRLRLVRQDEKRLGVFGDVALALWRQVCIDLRTRMSVLWRRDAASVLLTGR
jgi:hypothetical protein